MWIFLKRYDIILCKFKQIFYCLLRNKQMNNYWKEKKMNETNLKNAMRFYLSSFHRGPG